MAAETRENNLQLLLDKFNKGTSLSIKDIMSICNINRASVYNYINELVKRGYRIEKTINTKEAIYSMESSIENMAYEALTKKNFHKYLIMQQIAINGSITRKKLYSIFSEIDSENNTEDSKYLGLGRTRFYKMIKELLESEDIHENSDGVLTLTGKHYPVSLYFSDADELNSLCEQLNAIPQNDPFFPQLKSVYNKAIFILGDDDYSENNTNYLHYGCKYTESGRIQDFLKLISKYPYQSRSLKITHNTKNGERTQIIAIGMFVYSIEKDQLYIIGHIYDETNRIFLNDFVYTILQPSIVKIRKTQIVNPYFAADKFKEMYKTMFSVSTTSVEDVIVEFDRVYQVEDKIRQLSYNRPYSSISITEDGNRIVYSDKIGGLSDFAVYLRRFGSACHVIKPKSLKELIIDTRKKTLSNYEAIDD